MNNTTDSRGSGRSVVRVDSSGIVFIVGVCGWLFTIGFLHLSFWGGVLAIVLWPYDLGVHFSSLH